MPPGIRGQAAVVVSYWSSAVYLTPLSVKFWRYGIT